MDAGQLKKDQPILIDGDVWHVAMIGDWGDVAITRDDGGCIRVDHLDRHTDVLPADVRLAELKHELATVRERRPKTSLFAAAALEKVHELRDEIARLEALGVRCG
jgi:hypothetical protein